MLISAPVAFVLGFCAGMVALAIVACVSASGVHEHDKYRGGGENEKR